jgi:hypothetical protein
MEVSGLLHTSAALPPVKLDRRLGENQNRCEQEGVEKGLLSLTGDRIYSVIIQPIGQSLY